jgi:hypothetical protein
MPAMTLISTPPMRPKISAAMAHQLVPEGLRGIGRAVPVRIGLGVGLGVRLPWRRRIATRGWPRVPARVADTPAGCVMDKM